MSHQNLKVTNRHRSTPSPPPSVDSRCPSPGDAASISGSNHESSSSSSSSRETTLLGALASVQPTSRQGGGMMPGTGMESIAEGLEQREIGPSGSSGGQQQHQKLMVPPEGHKVDHLSELPDDLLAKMLRFLDIDSAVHCSMLAPRWTSLLDDKLYRVQCERVYLDQALTKALNLSRFKNSWKAMLLARPRVRLNGLYTLEASYVKKVVRDMWTEVPPHTILEVKYWRYVRFMAQNRLVYACTPTHPPHEAVRLIREGRHKEVCGGHYYVHKGEVHCRIQTSYAIINFRLEIQHGQRGHFSQLRLKEHSSVPLNDPSMTPIPHRISTFETFMFRKVPSF